MFKRIGLAGLSLFLSMNGYASDAIFDMELPIVWSSIITLSGGAAWANAGQNQYLYPNFLYPNVARPIDYFNYNSPTSVLASGEIFFGLQRIIYPGLLGELGIGLAAASDVNVTGSINVNGVPNANFFEYQVNHGRAELKGRLVSEYYRLAQPYISGSFGAGFNHSHAYVPTTINPVLFPPNWFTDSTNIAFSYTLGIGIQTKINPNWQVAVGYEFADWGKNYLGQDDASLIPGPAFYGPGLTHLYTNEVLLSLSYLF